MISFFEATLKSLSVHHTGNKLLEEYYKLSDHPLALSDELMSNLLMQFFLKPFEKTNEVYRLFHPSDNLHLNDVFHFVSGIFEENEMFHAYSQQLAKNLYDVANHPKIKSGEFYVVLFEKVQIEGEQLDAIGIFKSETKDTYLKVFPKDDGFNISYEQDGISINKLDKGCLIFNTDKEKGYKVVVFDQTKSVNDAAFYWKDEFLKVIIRNDNYNQTNTLMSVYKSFVTQKLDDTYEVEKADKVDLLNKGLKYFKEKETFDIDEFKAEVIGNEKAGVDFENYKENYAAEYETPILSTFEISDSAVKKQTKSFKNVIKLDKNFSVQVHGSRDMIVKGYDDEKALNYYKLYFRNEE